MLRKLRVEYPGAMYYIMSRGDQRDDIFLDDVGWDWAGALSSEGFLPASGRQLPDVVVRMAGQPPQDIVEVGIGFDPQPFAGDHEREEIGCLFSPRLLADVQPVASAQHHSSQSMFG